MFSNNKNDKTDTVPKSIYNDFQGLLPDHKNNSKNEKPKPENKNKVSYKSIDSYKPTGSFVFNQDFFNKN